MPPQPITADERPPLVLRWLNVPDSGDDFLATVSVFGCSPAVAELLLKRRADDISADPLDAFAERVLAWGSDAYPADLRGLTASRLGFAALVRLRRWKGPQQLLDAARAACPFLEAPAVFSTGVRLPQLGRLVGLFRHPRRRLEAYCLSTVGGTDLASRRRGLAWEFGLAAKYAGAGGNSSAGLYLLHATLAAEAMSLRRSGYRLPGDLLRPGTAAAAFDACLVAAVSHPHQRGVATRQLLGSTTGALAEGESVQASVSSVVAGDELERGVARAVRQVRSAFVFVGDADSFDASVHLFHAKLLPSLPIRPHELREREWRAWLGDASSAAEAAGDARNAASAGASDSPDAEAALLGATPLAAPLPLRTDAHFLRIGASLAATDMAAVQSDPDLAVYAAARAAFCDEFWATLLEPACELRRARDTREGREPGPPIMCHMHRLPPTCQQAPGARVTPTQDAMQEADAWRRATQLAAEAHKRLRRNDLAPAGSAATALALQRALDDGRDPLAAAEHWRLARVAPSPPPRPRQPPPHPPRPPPLPPIPPRLPPSPPCPPPPPPSPSPPLWWFPKGYVDPTAAATAGTFRLPNGELIDYATAAALAQPRPPPSPYAPPPRTPPPSPPQPPPPLPPHAPGPTRQQLAALQGEHAAALLRRWSLEGTTEETNEIDAAMHSSMLSSLAGAAQPAHRIASLRHAAKELALNASVLASSGAGEGIARWRGGYQCVVELSVAAGGTGASWEGSWEAAHLGIELFDHDHRRSSSMGFTNFSLMMPPATEAVQRAAVQTFDLSLRGVPHGVPSMLRLSVVVQPSDKMLEEDEDAEDDTWDDSSGGGGGGGGGGGDGDDDTQLRYATMLVRKLHATMLPRMDRYQGSDPFVVFTQRDRLLTRTERLTAVPGIKRRFLRHVL